MPDNGTMLKAAGVKLSNKKLDSKEFELPETVFVRDIENRVFQGIVLQCLATIDGISLLEGNFIESIFSRASVEGIKGIHAEQDQKNHSVSIRVELNICYGIPIPAKAEEIQTKVVEQIIQLTGLHVSSIHVVFKNIVPPKPTPQQTPPPASTDPIEEEYNVEF